MIREQKFKGTGLAIFLAVLMVPLFYYVYRALFNAVILLYSKYDPSIAHGLGAFILTVFGSSVFSFLSASVSTIKIFPAANKEGVFYGLSSLLVFMTILSILTEVNKLVPHMSKIVVTSLVCLITIYIIRIPLRNPSTSGK